MNRGGGQNVASWVEIDGVRYPLVPGSEVQRRPLGQFAPANQIGPNDRPARNSALSSVVFAADTRRGMGTDKHKVLDGIDTFRRSTLDTRFVGGITAPPKVTALAQCPLAANGGDWGSTAVLGGRVILAPTSWRYVYFTEKYRQKMFIYTTGANVWTVKTTHGAQALEPWRGWLVIVDETGGLRTSVDGLTFTAVASTGWVGLASFANRLWSFNLGDNKLYSCTDPTLAIGASSAAWTAQSEAWYKSGNENVWSLFTYRDRSGSPALYMATQFRFIGYDDDSGEFEQYEDFRPYAGNPSVMLPKVWLRDQTLYGLAWRGNTASGLHVYQFVGNVNEVGPVDRGGFSKTLQFKYFEALDGNVHWLYAATSGDGINSAGEIVAMNDLGGWHTVYRPTTNLSKKINGLCVDTDLIYVMREDGTFARIDDKDAEYAPHLRYISGETDTAEREIYFGKTDCGLPNHKKVGASVFVAARKPDGTLGLPANNTLVIKYAIEGGAFTTLATLTSATAFPIELPLPLNDANAQGGLVFRDIELYASLDPDLQTGTIEEVTLYFQKWTQPKWARQMVIDLREETFRPFANSTYENRGLGEMRALLEAAVQTQSFHRIKYGAEEWAVDIKASDLVMSGRENPLDGSGLFPITFRDITPDE